MNVLDFDPGEVGKTEQNQYFMRLARNSKDYNSPLIIEEDDVWFIEVNSGKLTKFHSLDKLERVSASLQID